MAQIKIDVRLDTGYIGKIPEGEQAIIGRILPDEADDAIDGLIGDYNAESSRNPLSWEDYNAEPVIRVKYEKIDQRELAKILSIERGIEQGAADTAADSLYGLLMMNRQR